MISKPTLTFYTNIPTPYQQSFFHELSQLFSLKVVYYSVSERDRQWNFIFDANYEIVILKDNFVARIIQSRIFDFHFSWKIFSIVWREKSEYIIVGGSYASANATIALLFNKFKGKKVIYFSEPLFVVNNIFKYFIKWFYLRLLNLCCDAIFCVGKNAADSFNSYNVTPDKYMVPYNIDEKIFKNLIDHKLSDYIKKYKGNDEIIILSSGSLIPRKGMDILIMAIKSIVYENLKLIIIGNGPQKQELMDLSGNDNRIVFAGFQQPDEIPYYFAIADIFAFASRYDGWGVVINEAIAANIPIISSKNVGASVEFITSDKYGILCQSGNTSDFKNAIELLLHNSAKRAAMKKNMDELVPLISSSKIAESVKSILINKIGFKDNSQVK